MASDRQRTRESRRHAKRALLRSDLCRSAISVRLALVLMVGLLCGTVPMPRSNALELWTTNLNITGLLPLVPLYEARTQDDLTLQVASADLMQTRIAVARALERPPDVVILPSDQLAQVSVQSYPVFPERILEAVDPEVVNEYRNGIALGTGHSLLLYYNKSLVAAPTSFEEVLNFASDRPVLSLDPLWPFAVLPFLNNAGLFDERHRVVSDPMPRVVAGLERLRALFVAGKIPPSCIAQNDSCSTDHFITGAVPYAIAGSWDYLSFRDLLKENLGVMAIPPWQGRTMLPLRFPAMLALAKPIESSSEQVGRVLALLESIRDIQKTETGKLLFGVAPNTDLSALSMPDAVVLPGSMYSPSDRFLLCLLRHLPTSWSSYFAGEIDRDRLRAQLEETVGGTLCEAIL